MFLSAHFLATLRSSTTNTRASVYGMFVYTHAHKHKPAGLVSPDVFPVSVENKRQTHSHTHMVGETRPSEKTHT